jgi:hypothetical protein
MDEATFFALLSKYPAVRKGDSAIRPARAAVGGLASLLGGAPPTKDAGGSLAPATVVPLAAAAPPSDFWAGLSDFLVKRFGAAQGKAVAAAFDSLHCALEHGNARVFTSPETHPPPHSRARQHRRRL